jgi:hypothetical protein
VAYEVTNPAVTDSSNIGSSAFEELNRDLGIVPYSPSDQEYDPKVRALLYTHPDYVAKVQDWSKFTDCYEANDMYQYVFKHTRESTDMFENRLRRSYYYNYVASVIDLFVSYLYHAPIERNLKNLTSNKDIDDFYKDANRSGDTFHIFIQMAAVFGQVTGHCGILVDAPKVPLGGFPNEQARTDAKHRPHTTLFQAHQIMDWETDEFGKFKWVKLETQAPQERDWQKAFNEELRSFVIWARDHWEEWQIITDESGQKKAQMLGEGANTLNEVPLVIVRNERCLTHNWMGLSAVRDIADINIGILNWCSLGDEEIYERCLNVLAVEQGADDSTVQLSHNNVLEYPSGAQMPAYLTPGESPLQLIGGWIDRAKDEIYRLAKLGGSLGLQKSREATSGIAYAYEFNETNQSLAKKAESLQQAEIEVHRLYAKWYGEIWDGTVTYPKEFGVDDFDRELQILAEARSTLSSETAIKEMEERLTSKLFAREDQTLRDKIVAEIQSGPASMGLGLKEAMKPPAAPPGAQGQSKQRTGSTSGKPPAK